MKKLILTEKQATKLMDKILSEELLDKNKYSQEVSCNIDYHRLTYNGNEIEWIPNVKFNVTFEIEMDGRSYGIKGISVFNFNGPQEIELSITYYPEGSEDPMDDTITVPIDWSNITTEEANIGWIGIDNEVELKLQNNERGELISGGLLIYVKSI